MDTRASVTQYMCPDMGPYGAWVQPRQCDSNRARYRKASGPGRPVSAEGERRDLRASALLYLSVCASCPGAEARGLARRELEVAPPREPIGPRPAPRRKTVPAAGRSARRAKGATKATRSRPAPPAPPDGFLTTREAAALLGRRDLRHVRERLRTAGVETHRGPGPGGGGSLYYERAGVERVRDTPQRRGGAHGPDEVTTGEAATILGAEPGKRLRRRLRAAGIPGRKTHPSRGGTLLFDRAAVEALAAQPQPEPQATPGHDEPPRDAPRPRIRPQAKDEITVREAAALLGLERRAARRRLIAAKVPHRKRHPHAIRGRAASLLFRRADVEALRDRCQASEITALGEGA